MFFQTPSLFSLNGAKDANGATDRNIFPNPPAFEALTRFVENSLFLYESFARARNLIPHFFCRFEFRIFT